MNSTNLCRSYADQSRVDRVFRDEFDQVVNLAAQAGVRYSIENPRL